MERRKRSVSGEEEEKCEWRGGRGVSGEEEEECEWRGGREV